MARRAATEPDIREITTFFDAQPTRVLRQGGLKTIFYEHGQSWQLPGVRSADAFIAFLLEKTALRQVRLESEHYRDATRYTWGEPRPYELALSLGKNPYLSHASAMAIHGLTDQIPKVGVHQRRAKPREPRPLCSLNRESIARSPAVSAHHGQRSLLEHCASS